MPELLWYDPVSRVGKGRKRHVYHRGNGGFIRACGKSDNEGFAREKNELERKEALAIASDTNTCQSCLETEGLDNLITDENGAETVEYDPFDVFD